jgi:D-alanyl-lipoteichoic acid acyltransferase DltB (MBOAT superfamily)
MLFNSVQFLLFLPLVFAIHWWMARNNKQLQNGLLLIASYYFYACWDWRFLSLLLFSTLLDYFTGLKLQAANNQGQRKRWLWLSIGVNLGILGLFKYFNFFIASFAEISSALGWKINPGTLELILPLGISFYTFHGLSYVIDVYKQRIDAEKNLVDYGLFVSFFPLLVAGPIERATHLLPQLKRARNFDYAQAVNGLKQILWGLFKKLVIADNCAVYANDIFSHSGDYTGSTLVIGALFFAFQIYGDFSGYSDIALGTARLFGIDLLRNFAYPYFSRDIAEFWRRWHISLSSWFRDYLYIPLGGSKGSTRLQIRNILIIFTISGLWHGANWTFIVWGLLNALYFIPLLLRRKNRTNLDIVAQGRHLPTHKEFLSILLTFTLTVFAWIFFRADNLSHAVSYIGTIFSSSLFESPFYQDMSTSKTTIVLLLFFIIIEWMGREQPFAIAAMGQKRSGAVRWLFYAFLVFLLGMYMQTTETPFIYFQF